jgi:hypothetical protein
MAIYGQVMSDKALPTKNDISAATW